MALLGLTNIPSQAAQTAIINFGTKSMVNPIFSKRKIEQ